MWVQAALKARSNPLDPTSAEEVILGYKRVQGSFEGASVGREAAKEESDLLSQHPAKYRPHRPHRSHGADFQGLRAVGMISGHRPPVDHYRAPRQVPTAYRPHENVLFCRSFTLHLTPAVGAVDTLPTFTSTSALCGRTRPVAESFREGEVIMEVLSSRVLLRPTDFECSFRFYAESLGLHVYRECGSGSTRGVVFFLGGGFLELSGPSRTAASESVGV